MGKVYDWAGGDLFGRERKRKGRAPSKATANQQKPKMAGGGPILLASASGRAARRHKGQTAEMPRPRTGAASKQHAQKPVLGYETACAE
eukprot:1044851-Pyramimonas_sp.AAC.1